MEEKIYRRPILARKVDSAGREYFTLYPNIVTNAVFSYKKFNYTIPGEPKLTLRRGDSTHGEELLLEHLVTGDMIKTPNNSQHNTIEIYFPAGYGIGFLKKFVLYVNKWEWGDKDELGL